MNPQFILKVGQGAKQTQIIVIFLYVRKYLHLKEEREIVVVGQPWTLLVWLNFAQQPKEYSLLLCCKEV
jgi:glucose-6-phosphate-specific signal transduction histidine kinase